MLRLNVNKPNLAGFNPIKVWVYNHLQEIVAKNRKNLFVKDSFYYIELILTYMSLVIMKFKEPLCFWLYCKWAVAIAPF